MSRARSARSLWIVLLIGVLALHFESRLLSQLAWPIDQKHFYPSSYLVSLSLLSGGGFSYVLPTGVAADAPLIATIARLRSEGGSAGPVMDFLSGEGRSSLSADEFRRFLDAGTHRVPIGPHGPALSRWETTRILELHFAAVLWRVFGISWPILFAFYAVLSTMACLLVSCITRRLTGSSWGGLLGAISFAASPFERHVGAWSIRDANPLWFACLAVFLLLRYAEPVPSKSRTYFWWSAIGGSSLLGLGWRPDASLLLPFALVGLIAMLVAAKVRPHQVALAIAFFVSGAAIVRTTIGWLGPQSREQVGSAGFHIAWYGDDARGNLLRTENVFQVRADDDLVLLQANYFRLQRTADRRPSPEAYDSRHVSASRAMYGEMVRYHAYAWWRSFPAFLVSLTRIDRALVPDPSIGGEASPSPGERGAWAERVYERCVKPYLACMPWLFALGAGIGVFRQASRVTSLVLAAYFTYYSAVLLMVLPEAKHWPPLLLPLHVFSAAGVWFLLRGLLSWRAEVRAFVSPRPALNACRVPLILACALALCWTALGLFVHGVSIAQRRRLVDSVMTLATAGKERPERTLTEKLHTVDVPSGSALPASGYLFVIRGGLRPADLFCVHVRQSPPGLPLYYYTRHKISPRREQFFFVNPVAGAGVGEKRSYRLHVRLPGGAQMVSVTRVDLSRWTIGLPLGLVFSVDDDLPGSAFMKDGLPITEPLLSHEGVAAVAGLQ